MEFGHISTIGASSNGLIWFWRVKSVLARAKHLRVMGAAIFVAGVVLASVLYFRGKSDVPEDASTVGFYKSSSRQMGVMYGQFGVMVDELEADLKRPGVQAGIVLVV